MTAATAAASKTRKAGAPTPAPAIFFISSASEDSSTRLRLQFLTTQIGLTAVRATLVAALAWGGSNG